MPGDPKALYYVTAVVFGLLVAWIAWVFAKTPTRKDLTPRAVPPTPVKRNIVKAPAKKPAVATKSEPAKVEDEESEAPNEKSEVEEKSETADKKSEDEEKAEVAEKSETKSDTDSDAGTDSGTGTGTDSDSDSDSDSDTGTETDSDTESDSDADEAAKKT
jgi:cell division protein FtsN